MTKVIEHDPTYYTSLYRRVHTPIVDPRYLVRALLAQGHILLLGGYVGTRFKT